jgi:hypothetical protein
MEMGMGRGMPKGGMGGMGMRPPGMEMGGMGMGHGMPKGGMGGMGMRPPGMEMGGMGMQPPGMGQFGMGQPGGVGGPGVLRPGMDFGAINGQKNPNQKNLAQANQNPARQKKDDLNDNQVQRALQERAKAIQAQKDRKQVEAEANNK